MTRHQQSGVPGQMAAVAASQRLDLRQRDIVNHGISVQESSNTVSAIEYLKAHDVAAHVIERVLLEPHRRRSLSHH